MNRLIHLLSASLLTALLFSACYDYTDVEQLYHEQYEPRNEVSDFTFITSTRATCCDATVSFHYDTYIKEVIAYCGTSKDSVLMHAGPYQKITLDHQTADLPPTRLFFNNLNPFQSYWVNIVVVDYADQPHDASMGSFLTNRLEMYYRERDGVFVFRNIGRTSHFGYQIDYDPQFSNPAKYAITYQPDFGDEVYVGIDRVTILPQCTAYVRPYVTQGGRTFFGETITYISSYCPFYFRILSTSSESVLIEYDLRTTQLTGGFYLAQHPITDDDPGTRYEWQKDFNDNWTYFPLEPGTYYCRPFLEHGSCRALYQEESFTIK